MIQKKSCFAIFLLLGLMSAVGSAQEKTPEPIPSESLTPAPSVAVTNDEPAPVVSDKKEEGSTASEPDRTTVVSKIEKKAESDTWHRVSEGLRLDLGVTYSSFQQQVKSEVGGMSVSPLVSESSFGVHLTATYGVWKYIRLGLFMQLDAGSRSSARFESLDAGGDPVVAGAAGGSFLEFWLGPLLRVQWKGLGLEVGWGAIGVRSDAARNDLPAEDMSLGALRTSPSIAWHAALSGYIPVHSHVDILIRIQYRVRYYNRRSGGALVDGVVHGTQNMTPTVGISYRLN